ncbi:MAG: hypothetical protein MRZ54_11925, partial [Clostridiales bacterium]|nr:hypothetical protein [Clostridiales bacterium]
MHAYQESRRIYVASSRRVMLVLMSLSNLYQYMYASLFSSALGMLPVLGGAMYMSFSVAGAMAHTLFGSGRKYLTSRMRVAFALITAVMLLCSALLIILYPVLWTAYPVWLTFGMALCVSLRATLGRRLTGRRMRGTIGVRAYWIFQALNHLLPLGAMALLLSLNIPAPASWQLWGGFAAGGLLEMYSQWRERDLLAREDLPDDIDPDTVARMGRELRDVNAYSAFQRMYTLVLMALQLTLVMVYTFIGLTERELLTCMLLTVALTVIMREISVFCLRRVRRPFATQLLLVGLFLWLYGLFLLYRQLELAEGLLWSYLALGLTVSGLTVSVTSLAELERRMTDVAEFKLADRMQGYSQMRAASTEIAILLGQMAALILLTLLCMPAGAASALDLPTLAGAFRPLMIAPVLLLVLAAIIATLRFPLNNRHFQKLAHWLTLDGEGVDNPALKKQLDSVVVRRHKNRFGVRIIITLLRPLYYHKVYGRENLSGYEDGTMILICNHGEIYGPVVANLYVPISFRPWVISNMMEREAIVEHMYQGTMVRQRWLPESWKRPLIRLITPIMVWVFDSLEAIPVYRGQPRELMKTFRETVNAMQAGDNILVFPENGEEHAPGQTGYVREGVGQLYTGFAMIAPMYYAKTHKRAVFVPIYASRKRRTLTIGHGVVYNPEANANEEKLRIVDELLSSMQAMGEM